MRIIVFLLVMVGLLTAYLWAGALSQPGIEYGFNVYHRILDGRAGTPYQQRVLMPLVMVSWNPAIETFAAGVIGFHFIMFPLWFVGLWLWLRRFGQQALAVTVLSGLYIVLGFGDWGTVGTWTALEMVLMVWLLVLIKKDIVLVVIIILATLNRPFTGVILAMVYLLYHGWRGKGFAMLLVWGVVFVGLLVMAPAQRWQMGEDIITVHWQRNTVGFVSETLGNNTPWLLVWGLALWGMRNTTTRMRRLAWVIPPYVLAVILGATLHEVRLLLTVYPLAGALMVRGLESK